MLENELAEEVSGVGVSEGDKASTETVLLGNARLLAGPVQWQFGEEGVAKGVIQKKFIS